MAAPKDNSNGKKKNIGKNEAAQEEERSLFSVVENDGNDDNNDPEDDVIELTDEDGNTELFEHLATLEVDGKNYLVLGAPDAGDDEELEVAVLRIDTDENGEDVYVSLDDDSEAEKVFDRFVGMLDDYETVDGDDDNGADADSGGNTEKTASAKSDKKEAKCNDKKRNGKSGK